MAVQVTRTSSPDSPMAVHGALQSTPSSSSYINFFHYMEKRQRETINNHIMENALQSTPSSSSHIMQKETSLYGKETKRDQNQVQITRISCKKRHPYVAKKTKRDHGPVRIKLNIM